MGKKAKQMAALFMAGAVITGMTEMPLRVYAEEEPQKVEEKLIETDEYGNVYEIEPEIGLVEEDKSIRMARSSSAQIVNFNTKGAVVTEYTEAETGAQGYTCGAYGADAAYLGTSDGKVRFMLSGVIGEIDPDEVQVVDISQVESLSCYQVSSGRLYHNIVGNVTNNDYNACLDNGPAPEYLAEGTDYYSYDGHYFYTYDNFENMLEDYQNGDRSHSVNPSAPYYNYFQYLPLRSQSNYSADELNSIINAKTDSDSKMWDSGAQFVKNQDTYGVNALMMAGTAALESGWGKSSIAKEKNNLFGLNAVDTSPGESANSYKDVSTCLKDFAETYMSKQYLRPGCGTYKGAYLGNKGSGINVHYASDPFWGEKIANLMWSLDRTNGSKDYGKYSIGIKDLINSEHTTLNVRKESNTSSDVLYKTAAQSQYAFLLLDNGEAANGFYRVQSDGVLTEGRNGVDSSTGNYNFQDMYGYASTDYISLIQKGNGSSSNVKPPENNKPDTGEEVEPVAVPDEVKDALSVSAHVTNLGWLDETGNGEKAGTVGLGYAMQAMKMQISGIDGLGIEYRAHVADDGWQDYVADGEQAGTTVPSTTYFAIRESDNRLVGVIDLRHHIDHPILGTWGGHCGYSVRPSERGKGYANEMLRLNIQNAKRMGLSKLLVVCDETNAASEKTILANGGVFEKYIEIDGCRMKRYWIDTD